MLYAWGIVKAVVWGTLAGRIIAAVLAGWVAFQTWLFFHDGKVERKVVAEINTSAEQLAKEAEKAREGVKTDGAFAELRKHYCIDC